MTATRVGLLALALTSGCLRFGYDASHSDTPEPDAGARAFDSGTPDAAHSADGSMDASTARTDASSANSGAGGAGGSGLADSGQGGSTAPVADEDAGIINVNDGTQMVGDTGLVVNDILGYYSSPTWGAMVLQAHGDVVWGVYDHKGGRVVGQITGQGLFRGWWTQTPSRTGVDAGEVEWTWSQMSSMPIKLSGSWRYGTSGSWVPNWNLDRVTDSSPPSSLTDLFNQTDEFISHP